MVSVTSREEKCIYMELEDDEAAAAGGCEASAISAALALSAL
jgi:hypothetical protein